jgi:tripartite-type tricarboxylate transporter receptor subunit TctC
VWAPAATPPAIVARLNAGVVAVLNTPDVKQRIVDLGFMPAASTSEELAAFLQSETVRWARVVKEAGITAE